MLEHAAALLFTLLHRSPYDLACDARLWRFGAYDSVTVAYSQVNVPMTERQAAIATLQRQEDRELVQQLLDEELNVKRQKQ